jgi:hypothetical protein
MVGYKQDEATYYNMNRKESITNFIVTCFYAHQNEHWDIEQTKSEEVGDKKLKFNKIVKHNSLASKEFKLKETLKANTT